MGIRNGKDINKDISTDVCVIGSGPAGITAAWHLLKNGVKNVTLIDGGLNFGDDDDAYKKSWPDKKLLYCGVADGVFKDNEKDFLIRPYDGEGHDDPSERDRVYGGTSVHWSGQCRPLDRITFEKRGKFPGWPIKRTDLDPYYEEACKFLDLVGPYYDSEKNDLEKKKGGYNFTTAFWAPKLKAKVPELAGFDVEMYQFIGHRNFATKPLDENNKKPIGDSKVDVILNANLRTIEHNDSVVDRLQVVTLNESSKKMEKQFYIKAQAYVLACGAVANARQLLLSKVKNDQIGLYFMCHPIANVFTNRPAAKDYLTGDEINLMRTKNIGGVGGVSSTGRFSPNAGQQVRWEGIGGCWFDYAGKGFYFEMAPNEKSRVRLLDETHPHDVFNQAKTWITWEFSKTDKETYDHSMDLFKESVEKKAREHGNDVKVSFEKWENVTQRWRVNGHHIGTTRMSATAKEGVVDKNLKVHSLKNLYVAGSSVFPTAGISNPTFTIVALSIRLAEHLSEKLRG